MSTKPTRRRYAVNCSILLRGLPISERLAIVRAAGFRAVEFWWPFSTAAPADADVDGFVRAVRDSGLQLIGLNLFAGDMPGGDRGVVSSPGRERELVDSVMVAAHIGDAVGCRAFNALYGNRQPHISEAAQDEVAVANLGAVAIELAKIGGTVLVEPVSGIASYPLKSADDVSVVVDRVADATGSTNLGMLLDMYHLAVNGEDVAASIRKHRSRIAHVQVADAPGRGAPGTGNLPLGRWTDDLIEGGYEGWLALEYTSDTADPFDWVGEGILG